MVACHLGLSGGLGNCNEALLGELVSVLCETPDMGESKFLFASNDVTDGCQGIRKNCALNGPVLLVWLARACFVLATLRPHLFSGSRRSCTQVYPTRTC